MDSILNAKIDQVGKILIIKSPWSGEDFGSLSNFFSSALPRDKAFTREHWTVIHDRLQEWKANLLSLQEVVRKINHPPPPPPPPPSVPAASQ